MSHQQILRDIALNQSMIKSIRIAINVIFLFFACLLLVTAGQTEVDDESQEEKEGQWR